MENIARRILAIITPHNAETPYTQFSLTHDPRTYKVINLALILQCNVSAHEARTRATLVLQSRAENGTLS